MKTQTYFISFFAFIIFVNTDVNAQQEPLFTQYDNSSNFFNPATSGLTYRIQSAALARKHWIGVVGAPETQLINFSMKSNAIHGGIGINYMHETIGFNEHNRIKLNYAFHLAEIKGGMLSFGASVGVNNLKISPTWVPPSGMTDPNLPTNSSNTRFTCDLGIAYKSTKLTIGLSVTQINEARYSMGYQDARHVYFFADYLFNSGQKMVFKPQVLIVTDFVKLSPQTGFIATMNKKYYLGLGVRWSDALIASVGWDVKEKYRIGYSFDYTINKLNSISKGSHEICLGYLLK
jgi:type IX secretion system PorP/SprF family membrane protein